MSGPDWGGWGCLGLTVVGGGLGVSGPDWGGVGGGTPVSGSAQISSFNTKVYGRTLLVYEGWGVQFPGGKRYKTLEWPQRKTLETQIICFQYSFYGCHSVLTRNTSIV